MSRSDVEPLALGLHFCGHRFLEEVLSFVGRDLKHTKCSFYTRMILFLLSYVLGGGALCMELLTKQVCNLVWRKV